MKIVTSCRPPQVDEPARGPEFAVRLAEPIGQNAVFGHAVQNAIRSDDGRVHRAGENDSPHQHDETVKQQA